jgi:hypothetical protein
VLEMHEFLNGFQGSLGELLEKDGAERR